MAGFAYPGSEKGPVVVELLGLCLALLPLCVISPDQA